MSHFLGVVTGSDNVTRPDDRGFLTLNQHPVRVLFREVKAEVRLDTLDELITQMMRVTNNVSTVRLVNMTKEGLRLDSQTKRRGSLLN